MSHEDRTVVTCLDASGRWRPARLTLSPLVIGNSNNEKTEGASPSRTPVIGNSNNREGSGWQVEFLENVERGSATPLDSGVVTGGFTDWHVHLHLIDSAGLAGSPITRVLDLGGDPASLAQTAQAARLAQTQSNNTARPPEVLYAGAFLTPSGGYPSDRSWAPEATYREVATEADATAAVHEMATHGASAIKIASNREAGPVFSDEVFRAIVEAARAAGLPVVAHAEGVGEALRAARLGATRLAHAPFSERLNGDELAELAASTEWCSTLDIHGWGKPTPEHEVAVANVKAFVRLGGRLLYGTDMGNGPTPIGLNPRELASLASAGLTPEQQIAALTPGAPRSPNATLLWVPRDDRGELQVAAARRLLANDLDRLCGSVSDGGDGRTGSAGAAR